MQTYNLYFFLNIVNFLYFKPNINYQEQNWALEILFDVCYGRTLQSWKCGIENLFPVSDVQAQNIQQVKQKYHSFLSLSLFCSSFTRSYQLNLKSWNLTLELPKWHSLEFTFTSSLY